MVNLAVREFSQTIIKFVNQSPLPIEIKRLCVSDIAVQLRTAADERIETEIRERDKQIGDDNPIQEEKDELIEDSPKDSVEKPNRTGNQ